MPALAQPDRYLGEMNSGEQQLHNTLREQPRTADFDANIGPDPRPLERRAIGAALALCAERSSYRVTCYEWPKMIG